ncbi:hypothetical protein BDN70DRAFT_935757 [Pholiota conissans]|uniref:Hydrophobin n=1 Tax=Pholiota conissans TaxID=109636 RepID=A0A9P5YUZ0_9AGAR|nr:hypothetical protein BDN70DRAFT_935757 [Pholiota conissans]
MRSFAILFALALPFFANAQCADGATALCCFDSQPATVDNLTQLGTLQNTTLPTDIPGDVGLLCAALDATCDTTLSQQLCCTSADGFDGVLALGCSALPSS